VHPIPEKAIFEIHFPRVEGYTQAIRNRVTMDWTKVPRLILQPDLIPPEVEVKGLSVNNAGKLSLMGPGRIDAVSLREYRSTRRLQELIFDIARGMTKHYVSQPQCQAPPHVLFPQMVQIIDRYVKNHVEVREPADIKDVGLSPYYGWLCGNSSREHSPGYEWRRKRQRYPATNPAEALVQLLKLIIGQAASRRK